ncbi:hypothetical protein BpHYR1_051599 [Brachionus plicatilis]|uniref:Uncharacterized protein n=1 Tax=Brachionus plicatilis TaxID=10195 RepID=A0A3M7R3M3_BRAPC|nr:hypothetical protein BpHYR1_051599 [Brachionus plicatilis]
MNFEFYSANFAIVLALNLSPAVLQQFAVELLLFQLMKKINYAFLKGRTKLHYNLSTTDWISVLNF